jgi:NCS1 family nucleobase:cation symporter-1
MTFANPSLVTLCAILGVVVTSACEVIYGVQTWNPLQVAVLMDRGPMFFVAFCFGFAVLSTNISANTTAVANDLMLAFPRYINIRRGQFICIIIALATTPWNIQNSAKSFTAFLSGYSVFLGPVCGIMLADYWFVRRRHLDLPKLYKLGPGTDMFYFQGFNLRAMAAFVCAIGPVLPGLIRSIGGAKTGVAVGASYLYSVVWPFTIVVSAGTYILFNLVAPYHPKTDSVVTYGMEENGDMNTDEKKI